MYIIVSISIIVFANVTHITATTLAISNCSFLVLYLNVISPVGGPRGPDVLQGILLTHDFNDVFNIFSTPTHLADMHSFKAYGHN